MPPLTDLSLSMRIDPLVLIWAVRELFIDIYGQAVKFEFPDRKERNVQYVGAAPQPHFSSRWQHTQLVCAEYTARGLEQICAFRKSL